MVVKTYKTSLVKSGDNLSQILDQSLPVLSEKSIVAISSKIVSLCENQIVKKTEEITKHELAMSHADCVLSPEYELSHGYMITIKNNTLISSAGIDEFNTQGNFVLWPKNPQKSSKEIWKLLRIKHNIKNLGVIITDSHSTPMRRGTTGIGIGWCGFSAIKSYVGQKDLYGRKFKFTNVNILDSLSAAAVLTTGEGNEQTPIAVITGAPFVKFQNRPPTQKEIKEMFIPKEKDVYAPILTSVKWIKGGK